MKPQSFLPLLAAGAAFAYPQLRAKQTDTNPSVNGLLFDIGGTTQYYAGTNSYWIGFLTNDDDVDLVMSHLRSSGLKVLRVWGFNDVNTIPGSGTVYYQALVPGSDPIINTGADGLQRLDVVVAAAERHGIKLIVNFVNNWTDYGGMAAYLNYFSGSNGNTASNNPSWYSNANAQAQYQRYIEAVVSRYSDSSAIFAWELANEPRCNGCDTRVIHEWASTTSAYIKSLDPSHMVTIGDEGFGLEPSASGSTGYPYGFSEGLNFTENLSIDTIDFGTMHLYPEYWGTSADWGNSWIADHGAACAAIGKPCVLEEFGYSNTCSVESQWQDTANSTQGIAGDMFWQLGETLSTGQTHNDGHAVYYGSNLWTCLVTNHVGGS